MNVQILVSTMHQKDYSLLDKLNIQSDAVIINQTDHHHYSVIDYNGHCVEWICVKERGLSRSRNLALSKAKGDFCVLVDDDEQLRPGYPDMIKRAFDFFPNADLIAFNLASIGTKSNRYYNKKNKKLNKFNSMRYGSARIAFRRTKILENNINFQVLFGAGSHFSSGEDSIFLSTCFSKGLNLYSWTEIIADIEDEDGTSSWFHGYNNKYFVDKGAVYAAMTKYFAIGYCLYFAIRHNKRYSDDVSIKQSLQWMFEGIKAYRNL
ncbi:glycosyltransferase [Exiguobacterium sp. SH5S13]|uniref:glycosyltransferase family 2 protein n=1 Tax=Exiguobacterium sp. SH5S13 TaxID=2510959 RepID=UPI00103BCD2D|nr:glycosyltransferase [Exiguobacterium sp. SH5S13]TCI49907.1 glycosyltransferase [Exiguobacterium sp. SH5S13]